MPLLDRAAIDAATKSQKLKVVKVQVPEFGRGTEAYIGQMSADERDERIETYWLNRKASKNADTNVGFRAFAVAACLCDSERNWIATTEQAINGVADQLGTGNAVPVSRMFDHASHLNGLTQADVEELEKNLPEAPSGDGSGG